MHLPDHVGMHEEAPDDAPARVRRWRLDGAHSVACGPREVAAMIRASRAATAELRRLTRRAPGIIRIGLQRDGDAPVALSVVHEVPTGDVMAESDGLTVCVDPTIASDGDLVLDVTHRHGFYLR